MRVARILTAGSWRRPVTLTATLAVAAAVFLAAFHGRSAGARSAAVTARTQILVDMPASVLVNSPGIHADTITTRAAMLADLASSGPVRARIARAAGIPVEELQVIGPSLPAPPRPNPLTERTVAVAKNASARYVMRLQASDNVPVLWVDATAPTAAAAVRLASATTDGLRSIAGSGEDGLRIEQLAAARVQPPEGPQRSRALLVVTMATALAAFAAAAVLARVTARRAAV